MKPYAIVDLHCDTLTDCQYTGTGNPDTLDDPERVLSLGAIPGDVNWAQFYAIWVQNEYRGKSAEDFFDHWADSYYKQIEKFSDRVAACRSASDIERAWSQGKTAAVLSVENGSALAGELNNVQRLSDMGVRAITLVWNGENEIASGSDTDHGFSSFGKKVVPEMERCGIIADVSHLNDLGFYEFLDLSRKPFMATHSNIRSVCSHKRNLTEDMVKEMLERDCLIGLNYYVKFIDDSGESSKPDDLYRHICRFLELGAEKNLALGSDFDGSTLPPYLDIPVKVAEFYEFLLSKGLSESTVNGIYYENAMRFLKANLG